MSIRTEVLHETDDASMRRQMLLFLVPLVVGMVLFVISSTISNIFVSRLTGVSGFAAVSTFIPFGLFLLAFSMSLSSAAGILIGQAFGAGDTRRIREVASTSLTATVLLALIIGGIGYVTIEKILVAFGTKPEILADATAFARATLILLPVYFAYALYMSLIRGIGDTTSPAIALLVGGALILLLTPALIEGYLGLPRLGVAGSAYATGLCQIAMLAVMAAFQHRKRSPISLAQLLLSLRVDYGIMKNLVDIGVWIAIRTLITAFGEMVILFYVNKFGSSATAAYGAATQIFIYLQLLAFSFLTLATFFASKEVGAGRVDRIPMVCRSALWLCAAAFGLFIAVLYACSQTVLSIFIPDAATLEIAHRFMTIVLWGYAAFGASIVFVGITGSDGTKVPQTIITAIVVFCVEVPVVYFLSGYVGLDGVWIGYPAVFLAGLILQGAYFAVWLKKPHEKLV
jgi:putative MATE family efflux protein